MSKSCKGPILFCGRPALYDVSIHFFKQATAKLTCCFLSALFLWALRICSACNCRIWNVVVSSWPTACIRAKGIWSDTNVSDSIHYDIVRSPHVIVFCVSVCFYSWFLRVRGSGFGFGFGFGFGLGLGFEFGLGSGSDSGSSRIRVQVRVGVRARVRVWARARVRVSAYVVCSVPRSRVLFVFPCVRVCVCRYSLPFSPLQT